MFMCMFILIIIVVIIIIIIIIISQIPKHHIPKHPSWIQFVSKTPVRNRIRLSNVYRRLNSIPIRSSIDQKFNRVTWTRALSV